MFTNEQYVPVLKAKKGELDALSYLSAESKKVITPLIEIPPISWNYPQDRLSKTIDNHIAQMGEKIDQSWGKENIFIDGFLLQDILLEDGSHALVNIFSQCRSYNISCIPTTSLSRNDAYQNAVLEISNQDSNGVCLRLTDADFTSELSTKIDDFCNFFHIGKDSIDLIYDLQDIQNNHKMTFLTATIALLNRIPDIEDWRTFTIVGTGFPKDLSEFSANTENHVNRTEWALWKSIIKGSKIKRLPSFGDYCISHPEMVDLDPRIMTVSASVRYTGDESWLIFKGRSTEARFGGFDQFYEKSAIIVAHPEYSGSDFSWGDYQIEIKSERKSGTGNATTWRAISTNHHIEKVVTQISSFLSS